MDVETGLTMITEKAEQISQVASKATYTVSGLLISGNILDFLNEYASALGVILAFITFLTNLIFQYKNHQLIKARHKDCGGIE